MPREAARSCPERDHRYATKQTHGQLYLCWTGKRIIPPSPRPPTPAPVIPYMKRLQRGPKTARILPDKPLTNNSLRAPPSRRVTVSPWHGVPPLVLPVVSYQPLAQAGTRCPVKHAPPTDPVFSHASTGPDTASAWFITRAPGSRERHRRSRALHCSRHSSPFPDPSHTCFLGTHRTETRSDSRGTPTLLSQMPQTLASTSVQGSTKRQRDPWFRFLDYCISNPFAPEPRAHQIPPPLPLLHRDSHTQAEKNTAPCHTCSERTWHHTSALSRRYSRSVVGNRMTRNPTRAHGLALSKSRRGRGHHIQSNRLATTPLAIRVTRDRAVR